MNTFYPETNTYQPGGDRYRVKNIHPVSDDCFKYGCVIHAPSDHPMRDWPTSFRYDRYLMERLCKHGVGHPDPDDLNWKKRTLGEKFAQTESVHGCDGCCWDKIDPSATPKLFPRWLEHRVAITTLHPWRDLFCSLGNSLIRRMTWNPS